MRLSTLAIALAALAGGADAQPIVVLNGAPDAARAAAPTASDCATAPKDGSADIECVLTLAPPRPGAAPTPPRRILIRTQWAQTPCAPPLAQVVEFAGAPKRTGRLPIVEQASSGRACGS